MSGQYLPKNVNKAANCDYFFDKSSSNKIFPVNNEGMDCCGCFSGSTQTTSREETDSAENHTLLKRNTKEKGDDNSNKQVCRKPTNTNAELFGAPGSLAFATEEGRRLSDLRRSRILRHELQVEGSTKKPAIETSGVELQLYSALSTGDSHISNNMFVADAGATES